MKCRSCEYPLWNLRDRKCPECGAAFAPSEFEFMLNSVRFLCPHCKQPYYGTDASGHLNPKRFACVSCDAQIDMDDMVLLPAEGLEEDQTTAISQPWLERRERGFVRAWFSTVIATLFRPAELARATPAESKLTDAWAFAILTQLVATIAVFIPFALIMLMMGISVASTASAQGQAVPVRMIMGVMGAVSGIGAVGIFLINLVGIAAWGLATHLILVVTGPRERTLRTTYHALLYSSGANVLSAIPFIGAYAAIPWWGASAVIQFKTSHAVTAGRASLCVLAPPIGAIVAVVGLYFLFIFIILTTALGAANATNTESSMHELRTVQSAVLAHSAATDPAATRPVHAAELIVDGYLSPEAFIAPDSATPVEDAGAAAFEGKSPDVKALSISILRDGLPDDLVTHRLGDMVLTYHGFDIRSQETRQLWIVIESPDPEHNPGAEPTGAALAGGGVIVFDEGTFPEELDSQNQIRAALGLPPLPDPATITADTPAGPP